jgi:RNA exonuclease 4
VLKDKILVGHAVFNDLKVAAPIPIRGIAPWLWLLNEPHVLISPTRQLTPQAIQHRHPYEDVRDTSLYYPLRKLMGVEREGEQPSLKKMAVKVLGREIQGGEHDPVSRARKRVRVREGAQRALRRGS